MLRVPIEVRHYPITRCGRICFDDRRLKKVVASLEQIDGVSAQLKQIGETVPRRVEAARAQLKREKKRGRAKGGEGVGGVGKDSSSPPSALDWRPQDCGKARSQSVMGTCRDFYGQWAEWTTRQRLITR